MATLSVMLRDPKSDKTMSVTVNYVARHLYSDTTKTLICLDKNGVQIAMFTDIHSFWIEEEED